MLALAFGATCGAAEFTVRSRAELAERLGVLAPGDRLLIAPGTYAGGLGISGLRADAANPVVITALDPDDPPVIEGGASGIHLSGCTGIRLAHLVVRGCTGNGINIDDGGRADEPASAIEVDRVAILDTGPTGNRDALKLSGVRDFKVTRCRFEGWGGSAIDMVGCHAGEIRDCTFRGKDGFSQDNGVQAKGGSSDIRVLASFFERAGQRAVNAGGSTGDAYFRPVDAATEAQRIEVAGCRFSGGDAVIAFVSSRDCRFHHNTIHRPVRWVIRILQESSGERFPPSGNHRFDHNLIVADPGLRSEVNVGAGTDPESCRFEDNVWHREGGGRRNVPALPGTATGNSFAASVDLIDSGTPSMRPASLDGALGRVGAHAWEDAERPTN